jgi:hypothetical protein
MKRIYLFPDSADGGATTTSHSSAPIIGGAGASAKQATPMRVDMPKAVPDNIKKMEFDINSFDVEQLPSTPPVKLEDETGKTKDAKETDTTTKKPEVKKEEPPVKKEEPKTAVEQLLKPPVKEEKKDEKKPVVAVKEKLTVNIPDKTTAQRDLTPYSPDEQRALKQMSNEGFELATRLIKENKDLSKLKDSTYLQHEHAYILDPQFQEIQMNIKSAQFEANHFMQQLTAAEKGEDVRDFLGWDKDNNPVYGQPIKTSAAVTEQIRAKYQTCLNAANQFRQKAQEIPTKYKQQITNDLKAISETCKEMFSWEKDEKLLEHTVPFEYADGVKDVSLKKIRDDFVEMIPPYMRSHPMTRVAANMAVAMRIGALQLAQAQTQQQVQEIHKEEVERGEISTETRPSVPAIKEVHGVTEFSGSPV